MITVTDNAIKHLQTLLAERHPANGGGPVGLRIYIEKGGCSGMEYAMKIAEAEEGDTVVARDGVSVLVDQESAAYLRGSVVDYHDGLTGSGFRIQNPNAVRTCGCGSSFEPAPVQ